MGIGCLLGLQVRSQYSLPPLQPEQDACTALSLCGNSFFTPYSYQGPGKKEDFFSTPCGGEETNSMWMKLTIASSGKLAFDIVPVSAEDDYDFAVFDVSGTSCDRVASVNVMRCNFNNNFPGSNEGGIVGLREGATSNNVAAGVFGNSFARAIDARPGQVFLIMINNFGNYNSGGPSQGFTLDLSRSTAGFVGNTLPKMEKPLPRCSFQSVSFTFDLPIKCSSVSGDGSEFYTMPALPINLVAPENCNTESGYTRQITIEFAGTVPPGNYRLYSRSGSDGDVFIDLCGNATEPGVLNFTIPEPVAPGFLVADTAKCSYDIVTVGPNRNFVSYTWSTGETSPTIQTEFPGTYKLDVTDSNGCTASASVTVRDSTCPEHFFLPNAFTPNGDGRNDVLRPIFEGDVRNFHFMVFNRWGQKMFESTDASKGWDGRFNGQPQPAGTYIYSCSFTLFRQRANRKGSVLLLR